VTSITESVKCIGFLRCLWRRSSLGGR